MNGIHDMGGMDGFGPIAAEAGEAVFHAAWEGRMFGISQSAGGFRRYSIECMPVALYLAASYYERWFAAKAVEFLASGVVTLDELATGRAVDQIGGHTAMAPAEVAPRIERGNKDIREMPATARFAVGDRVRTRNSHPVGHTRLPRYARDKAGVVIAHRGAQRAAPADAAGPGGDHEPVYGVEMRARDLWGPAAGANDKVYLDLWEGSLEPA